MTIESKNDKKLAPGEFVEPAQDQRRPALTVVFQTWTTPVVGIVMLVTGLFGGYFGRQFVTPETTTTAVEQIDPVIPDNSPPAAPTPSEDLAAIQQEFMTAVVENTRHFRGEPEAPVTIIEFSDFL